jgi:hypothetical protein
VTGPASYKGSHGIRIRTLAVAFLLLAIAVGISGCGRKARPEPRFGRADCLKQTI